MESCLAAPCRFLGLGLLRPRRHPMAADFVESQQHEPEQRPPTPTPYPFREPEHLVGTSHVVVGPKPSGPPAAPSHTARTGRTPPRCGTRSRSKAGVSDSTLVLPIEAIVVSKR